MLALRAMAILCFAASLTVHVSTFLTGFPAMDRGPSALHVLTLVVFAPAVHVLNRRQRREGGALAERTRRARGAVAPPPRRFPAGEEWKLPIERYTAA